MPLLRITSNQAVTSETQNTVLSQLSTEIASALGKSEKYVMTIWLPQATMTFGGDTKPTAYLELDSIGLTPEQAKQLSQTICTTFSNHIDVPADAIYIKFHNAPRALWGWNGGTFG